MTNLLKITYSPIQYQYEIERARLEAQKPELPKSTINRTDSEMRLRSQNIKVQLNTDAMRESMNMRTTGQWARTFGQQGMQAAQQAVGDYTRFGNQMQQIQDGVTIAQIVQNKMLEQPTTYTTFIPSVGPEINWQENQLSTQYKPAEMAFDWDTARNRMNYIPGKFSIKITQYPSISIEYMGDPQYVPPSANPNYEEPA